MPHRARSLSAPIPIAAVPILIGLLAAIPRPARADASWPGLSTPATAVGGGKHDAAVVVGLERYAFVESVPGAERNAKDWYSYLTGTLGTPPENVRLLLNDEAAKEDMESAAQKAAEKARKDGTLWFVFIGHGAPAADGKEGLLVGVDAQQTAESIARRSLKQSELYGALKKSQAKRIVVVLDACFSGRGSNGRSIAKGLQPLIVVTAAGAMDPRMAVLTAAKGNQFAGPLPGADRPAFSYLVLGGLRGWAGKAELTAKDLWSYARKALEATLHGRDQTPDLMGTRDLPVARSAGEKAPNLAALALSAAQAQGGGGENLLVSGGVAAPVPTVALGGMDALTNINLKADELLNAAMTAQKNAEVLPFDKALAWCALARLGANNPYADKAGAACSDWGKYDQSFEALVLKFDSDYKKVAAFLKLTSIKTRAQMLSALKGFETSYAEPAKEWPAVFGWAMDAARKASVLLNSDAWPALAYEPSAAFAKALELAPGHVTPGKAGIEWVYIPGGSFVMGRKCWFCNESPPHQVTIQPFEMSKTLVTNKQYQACV